MVILSDAADIARNAEIPSEGIYWNIGENCTANSRVIAHKDVYDEVVADLTKAAASWKVGDQMDPDTQNGALVSDEHVAKVSDLFATGKAQGATVADGGDGAGGLLFQPTVFADGTQDMDIFQQEIFGPVVAVTCA